MSVQTTERAAGFEHADVARAFAQALGKGQSALTADEAAFIDHVLEDFRPEELPQASASDLAGVLAALADVRAAVEDFPAMLALLARSITELEAAAPGDPEALAEDLAFLKWMDAGHFVFLGARSYDYPRTKDGGYAAEEPLYQPE